MIVIKVGIHFIQIVHALFESEIKHPTKYLKKTFMTKNSQTE
jgi:hypothetical protein